MWFNFTIISLFSTLIRVLRNTSYRLIFASYRLHKEYAKDEKNTNETATVFFWDPKNICRAWDFVCLNMKSKKRKKKSKFGSLSAVTVLVRSFALFCSEMLWNNRSLIALSTKNYKANLHMFSNISLQTFAFLNFLAESFIFSYMGLSVFTFQHHQWNIGFISWTFVSFLLYWSGD